MKSIQKFMLRFSGGKRALIIIVLYLVAYGSSTGDGGSVFVLTAFSTLALIFFVLGSIFVPTPKKYAKKQEQLHFADLRKQHAKQAELNNQRNAVDDRKDQRTHYADLARQERTRRTILATRRNSDKSVQTAQFNNALAQLPLVPIDLSPCSFERDPEPDYSAVKFGTITSRTVLERVSDFFVIDVETTGLDPYEHDIVQLSAIKFKSFKPVDGFSTYVNPARGINDKSAEINGITWDVVKDAPTIDQVINSFRSYVGDKAPLVGHNILFDLKFLCESGCVSLSTKRRFYDTLELSRRTYDLPKYKLDYLDTELLGINRSDAHDSLSDCLVTGILFREICMDRQSD